MDRITAIGLLAVLPHTMIAAELDHEVLRTRAEAPLPSGSESEPRDRAEVIWSFTAPQDNGDAHAVRGLGDVNDDGKSEAVVCLYDAGYDFDDLLCFDGNSEGTGTTLWSVDSPHGASGGGGWGQECLEVVSDMDGDGHPDILYGTAWGGRTFFCRSGASGNELWYLDTYTEPYSGWVYDVASLPDITHDGIAEGVAAVGGDAKRIYCVDGASTGAADVIWWFDSPDAFLSVATIDDVDGDGAADVLAGNGGNYMDDRVFCLAGAAEWTGSREIWSVHTGDGGAAVRTVTATDDIDGDGIQDVLAGSGSDSVFCLSGVDGSRIWVAFMGLYNDVMRVVPLGDVTADGAPEVLVGSWENAIFCLDGSDGSVVWETPTGTLNGGDVWTVDTIGDLDGDGLPEAIAGSFDTKVYVLRGTDGVIFDTFTTGKRLYSVAALNDIDGDGCEEVLAGTQGLYGSIARVYCLSGGSFVPLRLTGELAGGQLILSWSPYGGAAAYWVYGEANVPFFEPDLSPPDYLNRLAIVEPGITSWSTGLGVMNPAANWTFLIVAVGGANEELFRSNRVGEHDYLTQIP